jgi:uncharacterized membrane protein YphA (DoxX/SURF4 family)
VILTEAAIFLFGAESRHHFAATHMPSAIRFLLGWGEIIGSILLLIPKTSVRGAWLLLAIFLFAIAIHLLHGMTNVGSLVIYSAAAWAVGSGKAGNQQTTGASSD